MVMRTIGRIAFAWCTAIVAIASLAAQDPPGDPEDAPTRPRYMLFLFEVEPGTLDEQQEFLLYNSIVSVAAVATDAVVLLESPELDVPPTQTERERLAQSINADSWLHVIVSGGFEDLVVEVETFDLLRERTVSREIVRPGFVIDYRMLAVGLWEPIETTLQTKYQRIVPATVLTVEALPGSEVRGLSDGPHRVDDSGRVAVPLPVSSAYRFLVDLSGHYREQREIFVGIDPITLSVGQFLKPRFGVDVRITGLQFFGARFWYYPIPARVFVRAGLTTQAFGFFPIDNSRQLLQQRGSQLSEFSIDGGAYITRAERLLRFYAGAGGYLRFVHPSLTGVKLERDASNGGALAVIVGGEFSSSRELRFFLEYAPSYIFADDTRRFLTLSFASSSNAARNDVHGFIAAGGGLFDLRNVSIGARWDF